MGRTKGVLGQEVEEEKVPSYFELDEADQMIVLNPKLVDLLLMQEDTQILTLYMFYLRTAMRQKSNQPFCTTKFTANNLKRSETWVKSMKKVLRELHLIEDIFKNQKDGTIKYYIKVNGYFGMLKRQQLLENKDAENPPDQKGTCWKTTRENIHPLDKLTANALRNINSNISINNKNIDTQLPTLSVPTFFSEENSTPIPEPIDKPNKPSLKERTIKYVPLAKKLSEIISSQKSITHTPQQLSQWSNDIRQMEEANNIPFQRISDVLDWYSTHIGGSYIPVVESGSSLKEKFGKLEAAIKREQEPKEQPRQESFREKYKCKATSNNIRKADKVYDNRTGLLTSTRR